MTVIARTRYGDELLEFIPGDAPVPPDTSIPITFSMVILRCKGRNLFLYNPERQQWETPGGGIEAGETPDVCACREVQEETGQVVEALAYRGLFKMRLHSDWRLEYGALYSAEIDSLLPFEPNEESERILLWEMIDELEGDVSALSQALMGFCQ